MKREVVNVIANHTNTIEVQRYNPDSGVLFLRSRYGFDLKKEYAKVVDAGYVAMKAVRVIDPTRPAPYYETLEGVKLP
jgi:hypothetical protein